MDEYFKSQYEQLAADAQAAEASETAETADDGLQEDLDLFDQEDLPEASDEAADEDVQAADDDSTPVSNEPDSFDVKRRPYGERYYLLFGGKTVPASLDLAGTKELLTSLGFGNNSLKQARKGKNVSDLIERKYTVSHKGLQYCDFCGTELLGTEYESLADGRVRCKLCARTAVKNQEEFENIYKSVKRNMELFFGVRIKVPIDIKMVSAQKLHAQIGKVFVPTTGMTARTVGLAIREKDGSYDILMENGAPRMQSITTMVHEMTHIWQYTNWNAEQIQKLYGKENELQIYEGMARWTEIQYTYLINEASEAKRMELMTCMQDDAYGEGFKKYSSVYPLAENAVFLTSTPFMNPMRPL